MRASSAKAAVAERVVDPAVVAAAEAVRYGDYVGARHGTQDATYRAAGPASLRQGLMVVYAVKKGIPS